MRGALGILVCGALASVVLVGCGGEDSPSGLRTKGGPESTSPPTANTPSPSTTPAATPAEAACATVAPATSLSDITDAKDVRAVGKAAFFTSGSKVLRVTKDGKDKKEVFTSPDLTRAYVDSTTLIVIESTADNPDATTIRVIKAIGAAAAPGGAAPPPSDFPEFPLPQDGQAVGATVATNFHAAGTHVFASDETSFFVLADTAAGDTIVKINKDAPGTQTTIVPASTNVLTNPQVASAAVWYLRDQQRVYKVALADDAANTAQGEPTEVFGVSYTNVNLAVTESNAFITVGNAVERRDLTGANPTTIFNTDKSSTAARLGAAVSNGGTLFVRSEQPDPKVKHVIRELKPNGTSSDEKLVACGRELVTSFDVDAASVVWTEQKGVFIAPR